MSAATSPGTGLAYGLQRVCAAWSFARSSFYAMKSRQQATAERPPAKRRGPKPSISDEALLVAIEADLEASPWEGEGHRKVWARLRVCRGIRVSRKRVLRVMRENNVISPHRCRRRGGNPHVGEIITHAPNLMWGTDGVRVFTVDDGWGWIFTAIEHWNAECVGWHVCKRGDRFAALQPISMGLARLYASTSAGAARGLALRMDHGSQYLSDHFTNQIKFWGIQPSYAFVEQPQTNGVAERFNRTLKEQIIHGRIYRNIAELRNAVRGFVEQYNAQCELTITNRGAVMKTVSEYTAYKDSNVDSLHADDDFLHHEKYILDFEFLTRRLEWYEAHMDGRPFSSGPSLANPAIENWNCKLNYFRLNLMTPSLNFFA